MCVLGVFVLLGENILVGVGWAKAFFCPPSMLEPYLILQSASFLECELYREMPLLIRKLIFKDL